MRICCWILALGMASMAWAGIMGEEVTYNHDGTTLKGYVAWDDGQEGQRPGVLVVHEWWGHNEYARYRARELAKLGYVALAVDMYGEGKQADHPDDAMKFMQETLNKADAAKGRFIAAMDLLKARDDVDGEKIAAIGYCFGGGVVLAMARAGLPLKAVASFHGSLATPNPAKPGAVKARVLVCNGAADPFVKAEHIEAFKKEMQDAGVTFEFHNFPDAKHSFTNPDADDTGEKFGMPLAYDEAADELSWGEMRDFLKEAFAD